MRIAAGQTFTPSQPYTRYDRGSGACEGQTEGGDADAVFLLEEGATISRVVIGKDQSEGIHCLGKKAPSMTSHGVDASFKDRARLTTCSSR